MNLLEFRAKIKKKFEKSKSYIRDYGFSFEEYVNNDFEVSSEYLDTKDSVDIISLYEELGYCLSLKSVLEDLEEVFKE